MTDNLDRETRRFAIVVDGDVVSVLHVLSTSSQYERWVAGLSSNPTIIESTHNPDVDYGWHWDGSDFYLPEE
jgi:hypothetical protein